MPQKLRFSVLFCRLSGVYGDCWSQTCLIESRFLGICDESLGLPQSLYECASDHQLVTRFSKKVQGWELMACRNPGEGGRQSILAWLLLP